MVDTGDRDYYCQGEIECIDAIKAALGGEGFIHFLRGQVLKYNWRLLTKSRQGAHEDSIKAAWYQNRLTKELEDEQFDNQVYAAQCETISGLVRCQICHALLGDVHAPDCGYHNHAMSRHTR